MKKSTNRYIKVSINLIIALIILAIFVFLVPRLITFFLPFLVGWIIACIANPLVKFLEDKLKIRRKAVTALVISGVIALIVLIGYLVSVKLIQETMSFIKDLPRLWGSIESDMADINQNLAALFGKLPFDVTIDFGKIVKYADTLFTDFMGSIGTPTVTAVGNFAKNIPSIIISIIMSVLSAYFFIADKDYLSNLLKKHLPPSLQEKWAIMFGSLKSAVGGYFKAQLKIEIWMYLLLVIGFAILRIDYGFLIALGIAVLDLLPFFGTGAVMIPWAIIKILSADYRIAIGLLIMWGGGQLVRQLIQPKIVGDSIGVSPIPTLFLLFVGYKLAGVIGMIIALPIGIVIIKLYEAGVFDTSKNSIRLLTKQLNEYRAINKEDLEYLGEGTKENEKSK